MRRLDGKERVDGVMPAGRMAEGVFTRRRGDAEKKGGDRSHRSNALPILPARHAQRLRREAQSAPQARPSKSHLLLRVSASPREQQPSFFFAGASK
jgi:hypothetical protein